MGLAQCRRTKESTRINPRPHPIAPDLGLSRNAVAGYRGLAQTQGLKETPCLGSEKAIGEWLPEITTITALRLSGQGKDLRKPPC